MGLAARIWSFICCCCSNEGDDQPYGLTNIPNQPEGHKANKFAGNATSTPGPGRDYKVSEYDGYRDKPRLHHQLGPGKCCRNADVAYHAGNKQDASFYSQQVDGNATSTPGPGRDYKVSEYRDEAQLHHRLRGECFDKAREAYHSGNKQDASFYSKQGHLHIQKRKEANMKASKQILQDRSTALERNMTLDLHGLHVDEAIAALDRILPAKAKDPHQTHLTVVTGRGIHSKGGVARLQPAVLAYLQRHPYSFNEPRPGAFRVFLRN